MELQSETDENTPTQLRACCDLEYLLLGDLRLLMESMPDLQTRSALLELLNRLIFALPDVLERKSSEGYMEIVLKRRPNWSRQTAELHQANLDCISELIRMRDCVEKDMSLVDISIDLVSRIRNWMETLAIVRRHESMMLQEAFCVDLGGEA